MDKFSSRLRLAWRLLIHGEAPLPPSPRFDEPSPYVRQNYKVESLSGSWTCVQERVEEAKRMIAAELSHEAAKRVEYSVSVSMEDGLYDVRGDLRVLAPEDEPHYE